MFANVRRKYVLLLSLTFTALLVLLTLNLRQIHPVGSIDGGEIGYLGRRIAHDDSSAGSTQGAVGQEALRGRRNLALDGILLIADGDDDDATTGSPSGEGRSHKEWLKRLEAQHQDFVRRKNILQSQEGGAKGAPVVSRASQKGAGRVGSPYRTVTYESLKKDAESILQHALKREFASKDILKKEKTLDFTPGKMVDPTRVRRVLIASTWRSGSSYLGDLLRSYPGSFYSFEPLHHLLKNQHLQEGPLVEEVLSVLRGILTCDYGGLQDYISYLRNNTFLVDRNIRVWNSCSRNRAICFDKDYLSKACRYMPLNVIKTVRLGLSPLVGLLQDPQLDLKVLHLVRDPRGTMHSRKHLDWCISQVCSDPATVCKDLLVDLKLADWIKENFPNRYLLVRYEDLSLYPEVKAREILDFMGLSYNEYVSSFVREHTTPSRKTKKKNTYGTFRDSKVTAFAWRGGGLNFTSTQDIQDVCSEPLAKLRLRSFKDEEEYLNATVKVLLDG